MNEVRKRFVEKGSECRLIKCNGKDLYGDANVFSMDCNNVNILLEVVLSFSKTQLTFRETK